MLLELLHVCGLGGKRDKCLCSFPGVGRDLKKLSVPPPVLFPFFSPVMFQCLTSVCSHNHKSSAESSKKQRLKDSKDWPNTQIPNHSSTDHSSAYPAFRLERCHATVNASSTLFSIKPGFVLPFMESWITDPCGDQGTSTEHHIFKGMLFAAQQVTLKL